MRREYASAASVLTIPDFRTSGPTARLHDHRLIPDSWSRGDFTTARVPPLFSSLDSLCSQDTGAYDPPHADVLWGSLAVRFVARFLQWNLGRIFGGTPVNSACVFEVSAKEVSHDT